MKNKNNVTVNQLVDAIIAQQEAEGNRQFAYPYALGVIQSLLSEAVQIDNTPKNRRYRSVQDAINSYYEVANGAAPIGL